MSIDTHGWTYYRGTMPTRVKRTYNLAPSTVRRVSELSQTYGVAATQDPVIELAVDELDRSLREAREAQAWADVAADPALRRELDNLGRAYESADAETWPR